MQDLEPILPPELEEIIFALAYLNVLNDRKNGINLLLVARRVYDWLIPIQYKAVILKIGGAASRRSKRAGLKRHGHLVQYLLIWDSRDLSTLTLFSNLKGLALWTESTAFVDMPILLSFPLTRLSIDSTTVFSRYGGQHPTPAFPLVTHLDITDPLLEEDQEKTVFPHFPALTHLAIIETYPNYPTDILRRILELVPQLKVLIVVSNEPSSSFPSQRTRPGFDQSHAIEIDIRVVDVVCCPSYSADWERGARGGVDMFKIGERVVAERRRKAAKGDRDVV